MHLGLILALGGGGAAGGAAVYEFGELTRAGAGGIAAPAGASAISGGTATGYSLTGGFIVPTSNGSADSGTLTFTDSDEVYTMSAIADAYSVKTYTELKAALELATLAYGETVYLRTGSYNPAFSETAVSIAANCPVGTFTPPTDYAGSVTIGTQTIAYRGPDLSTGNYVIVTPHTGATPVIGKLDVRGVTSAKGGIWFKDLTFSGYGASSPDIPQLSPRDAIQNIAVSGCSFTSDPEQAINGYDSMTGIYTNGGANFDGLKIINCTFTNIYAPIVVGHVCDDFDIIGNVIDAAWNDSIKAVVGNNQRVHWNVSKNKKVPFRHLEVDSITSVGATTEIVFAAGTFATELARATTSNGITVGDDIFITGIVGDFSELNDRAFDITAIDSGAEKITFAENSSTYGTYVSGCVLAWIETHPDHLQSANNYVENFAISNISQAADAVITFSTANVVTDKGMVAGDFVTLVSIAGMTEFNNTTHEIKSVNGGANTITLEQSSVGYTAYSSGGTAAWRPADRNVIDGVSHIGNRLWRGEGIPGLSGGQLYFAPIDSRLSKNITNYVAAFNMGYESATTGFGASETDGGIWVHNTTVCDRINGDYTMSFVMSGGDNYMFGYNIYQGRSISINTSASPDNAAGDIVADLGNIEADIVEGVGTTSYAALFVNPVEGSAITDPAVDLAIKSTSIAYSQDPRVGAAGTGYVDYDTRTLTGVDHLEGAVPDAPGTGDWTVTDLTTGGSVAIQFSALPDIHWCKPLRWEYRVDGGSWVDVGDDAESASIVVSGLTDDVEYDFEVRYVTEFGNGTASAVKSETPTNDIVPAITYAGATRSTSGADPTDVTVASGTAGSRTIIVAVGLEGSPTISSVTFDPAGENVALTQIAVQAGSSCYVGIYTGVVTGGGNKTVRVDMTNTNTTLAVGIWSVTGTLSNQTTFTGGANSLAGGPATGSATLPAATRKAIGVYVSRTATAGTITRGDANSVTRQFSATVDGATLTEIAMFESDVAGTTTFAGTNGVATGQAILAVAWTAS